MSKWRIELTAKCLPPFYIFYVTSTVMYNTYVMDQMRVQKYSVDWKILNFKSMGVWDTELKLHFKGTVSSMQSYKKIALFYKNAHMALVVATVIPHYVHNKATNLQ